MSSVVTVWQFIIIQRSAAHTQINSLQELAFCSDVCLILVLCYSLEWSATAPCSSSKCQYRARGAIRYSLIATNDRQCLIWDVRKRGCDLHCGADKGISLPRTCTPGSFDVMCWLTQFKIPSLWKSDNGRYKTTWYTQVSPQSRVSSLVKYTTHEERKIASK